jgi:glycosyltransferase involved in cell wall biosynthesis
VSGILGKMQVNPLLSIVIPTYNRADFLDYCLEVHIPLAKAYNIQIFISDNASTDTTKEVVQKRMEEYPLISYHCNEANIGPDENFERALKYPETEYVWLLGDTYQIPSEGIGYLLNLISKNQKKYDAIVFNLANKITDIGTQDYTDQNALLYDLGALMTCLSCLVFHKELIEKANFLRYRNSYFAQTGIIFEAIAERSFCIHWTQPLSVYGINHPLLRKDPWHRAPNLFEISSRKWTNFIFSLPVSYELESKFKCLINFGIISGMFTFKNLLYLRSFNFLNYKTYKQYSHLFPLTTKYPKLIILLIALLPRGPLLLLYKSYKTLKRWVRGNYGIY